MQGYWIEDKERCLCKLRSSRSYTNLDLDISYILSIDHKINILQPNERVIDYYTLFSDDKNLIEDKEE